MSVFYVSQLRNSKNKGLRKMIPNKPGVYKWWCKKDLLEDIFQDLLLDFDETIGDIETAENLVVDTIQENGEIVKQTIQGPYYCVYVGDTKKLKTRILSQHIGGNIKGSTLRQTIAAVIIGYVDEYLINGYEDEMLIEPAEYPLESYHAIQNEIINAHFRPLNNDDIFPDNPLYSEERHYEVTSNGKGKKSYLITQDRRDLK